jgi:hypothetical protein
MYRYAVKASSKRGVEWLDKEILTFLSHAQDGDTVPKPDIDALANGMLSIMSEDKEYSELKRDNRRLQPRPKDVAPTHVAPEVVPVLPPLPVNALLTTSCESCKTSFQAREKHYKRCNSCQAEYRKANPYPTYPNPRPVMMVAPVVDTSVINPLDVYGEFENTYRDGKHVLTVNINRSDRHRVSEASVEAITRKGDPGRHYIVDHGCVLDTGAALTIAPTATIDPGH